MIVRSGENGGQRRAIALHLGTVRLRYRIVVGRGAAGLVVEGNHFPLAHQQPVDLARDHPVAHDRADRRLGQGIGREERGERRVCHERDHGLSQRLALAVVEIVPSEQASRDGRALRRRQRRQMFQQLVCGDAAQPRALPGGANG